MSVSTMFLHHHLNTTQDSQKSFMIPTMSNPALRFMSNHKAVITIIATVRPTTPIRPVLLLTEKLIQVGQTNEFAIAVNHQHSPNSCFDIIRFWFLRIEHLYRMCPTRNFEQRRRVSILRTKILLEFECV